VRPQGRGRTVVWRKERLIQLPCVPIALYGNSEGADGEKNGVAAISIFYLPSLLSGREHYLKHAFFWPFEDSLNTAAVIHTDNRGMCFVWK